MIMASDAARKKLLDLLKKYAAGNTTPEETAFVEEYFRHFDSEAFIYQNFSDDDKEAIENRLLSKIESRIVELETAPVIPMWKKITRVASVAAIVLLIAGAYWLVSHKSEPNSTITQNEFKKDIHPGTTKATLTLDNGKQIVLDTTRNGLLAREGTTTINNAGGALVYAGTGDGTVRYNILTTHKAEQYPLTLSDGTRIFVDASTTIRYPVVFLGKERRFEIINGHVWFEVAKNPAMPFYVVKGDRQVKVLGTHFDVNAYDNEPDLKVTLVEGSVQVSSGNNTSMLKPGGQAVLQKTNHSIQVIEDADVEEATAWMNGKTTFHSADLGTVSRFIERWYDVEVVTDGKLPERIFYVDISRNANLSALLKAFDINKVHYSFDSETKKLTIMP